MRTISLMFVLVLAFSFNNPASAENPTGNTQQDIQRLFQIIDQQDKIIKAQDAKIKSLESKLAVSEDKTVAAVVAEVEDKIKPGVTTAAGLREDEKSGWFAKAEGSILKPGGLDDIDYVAKQHPADSEGTIGDMYSIDFDWQPAWRVAVGKRYDSGEELAATYWGTMISDKDTVSGDNLHAVLLHAETGEADDIDYASAEMDVDMYRLMFDYTHPFYENRNMRLAWFGAFNYMFLHQKLYVDYRDAGAQQAFLRSRVNSYLFGPGAGLKAEYALNDKWSVNTNTGANLLVNLSKLKQVEGPITSVDAPQDIKDDFTNVTPLLETYVGLTWRPNESWKFGLGYEFMWLYNVYTLKQGLDDTSDGQQQHFNEDVTLHGATLSATYTF